MSNIIRIRDLVTETSLSEDILVPIDKFSYSVNAKKMTLKDLTYYITNYSSSFSCMQYDIIYSTGIPNSGVVIFDEDDNSIKISKYDRDGANRSIELSIKFKSKQFGMVWSNSEDDTLVSGQFFDQCEYHIFDISCVSGATNGLNPPPTPTPTGSTFVMMDVVYSPTEYGLKTGGDLASRVAVWIDPLIVFTGGTSGVKYTETVYRRTGNYSVETVDQSILSLMTAYRNDERPDLGVGYIMYADSGMTIDAPQGYYMSSHDYAFYDKQNCGQYRGSSAPGEPNSPTGGKWALEQPGWNGKPLPPTGCNLICSITGQTLTVADMGVYYEIPWIYIDSIGSYSPTTLTQSKVCIDMSGMKSCPFGSGSGGSGNETLTFLSYDNTSHTIYYEDEDLSVIVLSLNVGDLVYDDNTNTLTYTKEDGGENVIELSGVTGVNTLSGLTDTAVDSIQEGDVLVFINGIWVNSGVSSFNVNTLSGLTDTALNNIQEGDVLIFKNGIWVNSGGTGTIFINPAPTPEDVGGVEAGSTFPTPGKNMQQMWDHLLYPYQYPEFTSFLLNKTSPEEIGDSFNGGTFTWTTSNPTNITPNTIQLSGYFLTTLINQPNDGSKSVTFTSDVTRDFSDGVGLRTWDIQAENTKSIIFTANLSIRWDWMWYYGTSPNILLTEPQIQALDNSALYNSYSRTFSCGGDDYKYICFADTVLYGGPSNFFDADTGFAVAMYGGYSNNENGYTYALVSVTNIYGQTIEYRVYRTQNTIIDPIDIIVS